MANPLKIFCTGNPKRQTVAYALKDYCDHASLSTGWDFTDASTLQRFSENILNYNVFVNSSYIGAGVQASLMDIVYDRWIESSIRGHVITIGTTLEDSIDSPYANSEYANNKRALRKHSVELSCRGGVSGIKFTYLVLGGINNGEFENCDYVMPCDIAASIFWVLSQNCRIPLLQLDGNTYKREHLL